MNFQRRALAAAISLCSLLMTVDAGAIDTGTAIKLDGFGTFAGVSNDNTDVSFYDANKSINWDTDSVVGLQMKAPLMDHLSVTGQVVARGYEDYDPQMEWLFLTYDAGNNLKARAGRLRIPFFMFSDTLEVGYSYPWVRPPVDVYGQLGFNRYDGADVLYAIPMGGDMQLNLQPFYGKTTADVIRPGQDGTLEVRNLWGLHASLTNDWLTLSAGHTEGDFDIKGIDQLDGFLKGLNMMGYGTVADKFGITDRHGTFDGVGVDANLDNWRFIAEYTKRGTDGLIANTKGWYTTVAYQYGKWTPHLTFSKLSTTENYDGQIAAAAVMPPMMAGGTMQFVHENTVNQSSVTAGVRWNVMRHTALKAEWQRINPDEHSSPLFVVTNPAHATDPINIYTVAVDFVF